MTDHVVPALRRGGSSGRSRRGRKLVWAAAVLACAAPALGSDETSTWLGGTGNWSNSTLWSNSPPVNQFPNNGNGGLTYDAVINSGSVTLDQDISINGLTFTGGTITGPSSLTLNANSTWTGGGVMSGSGTTTVTNGIAIGPGGNSSEGLSRTLNLSAGSSSTLDPSQQGPNPGFYIGSGGVLNNSGTLTITNNGTVEFTDPTAVFNNSGTLNINGPTGTVAFSNNGGGTFNNSGALNVSTGTLQLGMSGNHTGSFAVASGAILEFSGGTQNLQSQSSLTGAGTAVFAATTNINGTYNVATTGISQPANFNSSASTTTLKLTAPGNLGGSGTFTVTGTGSTWTSGTMSGTGTTTILSGIAIARGVTAGGLLRTMNLSPGSTSTLDLSGSTGYDNPGFSIGAGGTLSNSGTLTIPHNGAVGFYDPTAVFNNSGTMNVNGPTGTVLFTNNFGTGMAFNNSGTVNVNTGTLQLGVAGNHTGSFAVASGAVLEFYSGGTQTLQSQSSLTGAGTAVFAGTTNINGAYNVATTGISQPANFNSSASTTTLQLTAPGNLGGSGTFTVTGTGSTWTSGTMSGSGTTTVTNGIAIGPGGNSFENLSRTLNLSAGSTSTLDPSQQGPNPGFYIGSGGVLNNSGTLTITRNGTVQFNDPTAVFNNSGTLNINGPTGTVAFSNNAGGAFNNSGAVNVDTGTLQLGVGGSQTGSFAVASGATLDFHGGTQTLTSSSGIRGAGTFNNSGATTTVNGTYSVATTAISGQAANFNSTASTTTLQLSGNGNLGGSGSFTVAGAGSTWTSGTMSGTGTTTIINGIAIGPSAYYTENLSRSLNLSTGSTSTVDLSSPFYIGSGGNGGTLNNSGTLTITHNGTVVFNDPAAVFNNSGTLNINGPTGTVAFSNNAGAGTAFNNSGMVNVNTGTLQVGVFGSHSGSFAVSSGATLQFQTGTQALQSSSSITGAGTVLIGGATVNVGGTYNVGTTNVGSGTINFNAPATTNALTISGGTVHGQSNLTVTNLTNNAGSLALSSASISTLTLNGGITTVGPGAGGGAVPATAPPVITDTQKMTVVNGNNTVASGGAIQVDNALDFTGTANPTLLLNSDASVPGRLNLYADLQFSGSGTAAILNSGTAAKAGFIDMNNAMPRTFTINPGGTALDMTISATLTNGALNKGGSGWLQLTAANTYTGGTTITAGTLEIDDPGGLGTGAVTFSGGALALRGKAANAAIPNALNGSSASVTVDLTGTSGTVQVPSATLGPALNVSGGPTAKLLIAGPVTLTQTGTMVPSINNSANLEIAGTISGSGNITKTLAGTLTFSGGASNTYTGITTVLGGALALAKTGGATAIPGELDITGPGAVQLNGSQQIASSATIKFNSQPAQATLNLNGYSQSVASITDTNGGTILLGGGTLTVGSVTVGPSGTLSLAHNATPSTTNTNSLTIAPGGKLDLANNTLMIHYTPGADPMPTILTYLASGYDNGKWDGSGIISSTAASNAVQTTAIAYADSADGVVSGIPANTIELKYDLIGSTYLSGSVGPNDFTRMSQHYHQATGGTWDTGDFNYDGSVNFNDFMLLTRTYNTSLGSTAQPAVSSATAGLGGASSVPEPGMGLLGMVSVLFLRRRRRRPMLL